MIDQIKNDITNGNIKSLLKNITNEQKQDLLIKESDIFFQITSSDYQNNRQYSNISTIKLRECEKILKEYYNIDKDDSLLIFKIDFFVEGLLMPIVEYEIYHPYTLEKLELSICNEEKIQISVPVTINEEYLFKHEPNSIYYNDKCYPSTSENDTDIILSDRKNEFINNNLTLCENNCEFSGYNNETKQAICECEIKNEIDLSSNMEIDKDKLLSYFSDIKSLINIDVMKCYKLLFTKEGIIKNIGSYVLLFTIFVFFVSLIIFMIKAIASLNFSP